MLINLKLSLIARASQASLLNLLFLASATALLDDGGTSTCLDNLDKSPATIAEYRVGSYLGPSPGSSLVTASDIPDRPSIGGGWPIESCPATATDYPVGIYLGPSYLTSSRYNAYGDPVTLARVPANPGWTEWTLAAAQNRSRLCRHDVGDAPVHDPSLVACGEIIPAFFEAMNLIVDGTTEKIGGKPFKIGFIVVARQLRSYFGVMDEMMHKEFKFQDPHGPGSPCNLIYDIMTPADAVKLGYNIADPDTLGIEWEWPGNHQWPSVYRWYSPSFVLLNLEPTFLEISYVCVDNLGCDGPGANSAFFHLGEKSLWEDGGDDDAQSDWKGNAMSRDQVPMQVPLSRTHGSRVELLSSAIADFINRTSTAWERRHVRTAVIMGGASPRAMDALHRALSAALPFVEPGMIMSSIEPAFVPSLGAALRARDERIVWYYNSCEREYGPLEPPAS